MLMRLSLVSFFSDTRARLAFILVLVPSEALEYAGVWRKLLVRR